MLDVVCNKQKSDVKDLFIADNCIEEKAIIVETGFAQKLLQ